LYSLYGWLEVVIGVNLAGILGDGEADPDGVVWARSGIHQMTGGVWECPPRKKMIV